MKPTPQDHLTTSKKSHRRALARHLAVSALLVGCFLSAVPAIADGAGGPVYTGLFNDLALGGYDPVAYFKIGKATKGSSKIEVEHRGATWRFASVENKQAFEADPDKYSPQYGGYCAWAMASGDKAAGKAPFWKIVDGKLYLNYSGSVQKKWQADIEGFIAKADQEWPAIRNGDN